MEVRTFVWLVCDVTNENGVESIWPDAEAACKRFRILNCPSYVYITAWPIGHTREGAVEFSGPEELYKTRKMAEQGESGEDFERMAIDFWKSFDSDPH